MPAILISQPQTQQVQQQPKAPSSSDAVYWNTSLSPLLSSLMVKSALTSQRRADILSFFATNLIPFLGPKPKNPARRFKSFMTADNTPLEASLAWPSGSSTPRMRFAIDIIPKDGSDSPAAVALAAMEIAESLRVYSDGPNAVRLTTLDLELFYALAPRLVLATPTRPAHSQAPPSQAFFGLDIEETTTKVKAYFMPTLRADAEGCDAYTLVDRALGASPAWRAIASYIRENFPSSPAQRPQPFIVSVDCLPRSEARIKVYFRFPAGNLDRHLSLGGRTAPSARFMQGAQALAGDAPTCVYYDFRWAQALPASKAYVPLNETLPSDARVADVFAAWFATYGNAAAAAGYARFVQSLTRRDLRKGTGFHTYVGVAPAKDGACEATTYFNPCLFS